jgi:hypothetical protein
MRGDTEQLSSDDFVVVPVRQAMAAASNEAITGVLYRGDNDKIVAIGAIQVRCLMRMMRKKFFNVCFVIISQHYVCRPKMLEHCCFVRFMQQYMLCRLSRVADKPFGLLSSSHPLHSSHAIVRRRGKPTLCQCGDQFPAAHYCSIVVDCVPKLTTAIASRLGDVEALQRRAHALLSLYRPWRVPCDLRRDDESWLEAFDGWWCGMHPTQYARRRIAYLESAENARIAGRAESARRRREIANRCVPAGTNNDDDGDRGHGELSEVSLPALLSCEEFAEQCADALANDAARLASTDAAAAMLGDDDDLYQQFSSFSQQLSQHNGAPTAAHTPNDNSRRSDNGPAQVRAAAVALMAGETLEADAVLAAPGAVFFETPVSNRRLAPRDCSSDSCCSRACSIAGYSKQCFAVVRK